MNTKKNLAFTVELLSLFILLILVITVITQVFVMSRSHSLEAKRLTAAVIAAESTAEIASTESDVARLSDKITSLDSTEKNSVTLIEEGKAPADGTIWFSDTKFIISIERKYDKGNEIGIYADDTIRVFSSDRGTEVTSDLIADGLGEPIYTLESGNFFREVKP